MGQPRTFATGAMVRGSSSAEATTGRATLVADQRHAVRWVTVSTCPTIGSR